MHLPSPWGIATVTAVGQANRGAWIIAGAILIAAAAIIFVMLSTRAADRECQDWQARVRGLAETTDLPSSAFGSTEGRPDGCPLP